MRAARLSLETRAWRCAARVSPEQAPRLLAAVLRAARPDCRADVLLKGRRGWEAAATQPGSARGSAPLHEPSVRARALPVRTASAWALPAEGESWMGDAALRAEGYAHRLLVPLRIPKHRAVASVASRTAFSDADIHELAGLARCFEGVLATRARVERARQALRRTRFIQRLVASVNRSLLIEDIFRAAVARVREGVPVARALFVVTAGARDITLLKVDGSDGFRHFETERIGSRARTKQVQEATRVARVIPDIAAIESPDELLADLLAAGHRSALILPLFSRRKPVGALALGETDPGALTRDHLTLLKDLARPLASAVEKARLFREAAELSRQMTALYDVGQALNSPLDTAGVTERVLSILHETFRFQHSAVLTLERDAHDEWLVMQASRGYSLRDEGAFRMKVGERGVTNRAVRTGRLVYVPDVRRDPDYVQGVERGRSEVAIPLLVGGRVVGVLDVESTRVDAFAAEDLETLKLFSTQVALALARARTFEEIRRQAMTDSLTGLLNQRYFQEKVEREIDRSRQTGRPFVLALFDVDDFKRINDDFGHNMGDVAIMRMAEVLRGRVKSIDAAARFGGDEFALILSEADEAQGLAVVEGVRADLKERPVGAAGILRVSVGVAQWRPGLHAFREMVAAADAALYRAKDLGKDQAAVSPSGQDP